MSTLAPSFWIEFYSFLHVTRTAIKAWIGLKFCKIWPGPTELAALECVKKSPSTYNGRNVVSSLVLSVLGDKDNYESMNEFEFLPDHITKY